MTTVKHIKPADFTTPSISKKERFDTLVDFLSRDSRLVTGPEEIAIYQEFDTELARLATVAGDAILAMVKHVQGRMLDGKVYPDPFRNRNEFPGFVP